jgi:OOP family OmpA-OmpF porin
MVSIRKTVLAISLMLLIPTACAGMPAQEEQPETPAASAEAQDPQTPAAQDPTPPAQPTDPAAYVPRTEHDNTPWRFNMQQDGRTMTADEFDAWMKSRGVRVATGQPATPRVQTCPTPEGDRGDNDGDGVINCLDQCPDSQAGQTIGPDGCPVPVSIDLRGVTFAYDTAELSGEATAVLDEAVEILKRHPGLTVEVAGHTDARGAAEYNQRLSERRAQAVYDYLVEHGIEESRLIGPKGFGETRPIVPNQHPDGSDNPEGRAKNRRVELNIQN